MNESNIEPTFPKHLSILKITPPPHQNYSSIHLLHVDLFAVEISTHTHTRGESRSAVGYTASTAAIVCNAPALRAKPGARALMHVYDRAGLIIYPSREGYAMGAEWQRVYV